MAQDAADRLRNHPLFVRMQDATRNSAGIRGLHAPSVDIPECASSFFFFYVSQLNHSFTFRSRKALPMTETELRLIAAPAMTGLSSSPKTG